MAEETREENQGSLFPLLATAWIAVVSQPVSIEHSWRRRYRHSTLYLRASAPWLPERVAMQLTGHKTRSVFERYNIVSDGDLLAAARKLDRVANA